MEKIDINVVGICENGATALDFLSFYYRDVDIVITDIKMPGMDGIEFAKTIQKDFPDTLVIVLSAYRDFEYARQCMTYGVIDYILKPITFSKMKTAFFDVQFISTFSSFSFKILFISPRAFDGTTNFFSGYEFSR